MVAGGRCGDLHLLRIRDGESGPELVHVDQTTCGSGLEGSYAPIRDMELSQHESETAIFAGCDNGVCYRVSVRDGCFGQPSGVWCSPSPIRVVAAYDEKRLVLGDASGQVAILRWTEPPYFELWRLQLYGAVTGAVRVTLRVPDRQQVYRSADFGAGWTDEEMRLGDHLGWEIQPVLLIAEPRCVTLLPEIKLPLMTTLP